MAIFNFKNGKSIPLKGAATKEIVEVSLPQQVAILPGDFRGLKPRVVVKVDDHVKVGSPIITDKKNEQICIASPASGKVVAINRGPKRVLLDIVIETDGKQDCIEFKKYSSSDIQGLHKDEVIQQLLASGTWPVLRQRPFSNVANSTIVPRSIFVHAMNTEPLALDVDVVLEGKEDAFQVGIDILTKLTGGSVYLCVAKDAKSKALTTSKNVEIHQFAGPHPTGNVSTHIQAIEPLNKGDSIWYVEALDVLRIASLFLSGAYSTEKYVATTGEGVKNRVYTKTVSGVKISSILQGSDLEGMRCISGSVLTGKDVGRNGFLGFYDSQVTIIPEGGKRKFLGWLAPGFDKYTFSKTFLSALDANKERSLDTDKNGSDRAIVLNHLYDDYITLGIPTYFLLKAVIAGDIEEAEKLGILECDEEDFALATFACPSKTDVGGVIRAGLDIIEKEG